ncbi:predicted protein, partial [Thalassiosira pseudonana CCMP1335]
KSICKERFPKKYRHPKLDVSLTKNRTKAEARCLIRCRRADVPCPNVLGIGNWSNGTTRDDADGNEVTNTTYQQQERITTMIDSQTLSVANILGGMVAKMHAAGVIHGDLTTSNVMIRNPLWVSNGDQHKQQNNAEEKAVDLYVLERAFLSTHPESEPLPMSTKASVGLYTHVVSSVMNRLEQVRLRGRKRECFG